MFKDHVVVTVSVGVTEPDVEFLAFFRFVVVNKVGTVVPTNAVFFIRLENGIDARWRGPIRGFLFRTRTQPLIDGALKREGMFVVRGPIDSRFNIVSIATTQSIRHLLKAVGAVRKVIFTVCPRTARGKP